MLLQEYLNDTHEFATPEQWGVVQSSVPHKWIEQALQMNGVATLRKRRLPMEQALWPRRTRVHLGTYGQGCRTASRSRAVKPAAARHINLVANSKKGPPGQCR